MVVLKFGGTSIGSPERMKNVLDLVTRDNEPKIVVLSAVSGTTNALYEIGEDLEKGEELKANEHIENLKNQYLVYIDGLLESANALEVAKDYLDKWIDGIHILSQKDFNQIVLDDLVAYGEVLSTMIFTILMHEQSINGGIIQALDFMTINENGEPDLPRIKKLLTNVLAANTDKDILVTQGFICRDTQGNVTNLRRGGSDFTASLIGVCSEAVEIQIWTDIDGMHNNDPREVEKTVPLSKLSFDEAAELAYFGAKILHPATILPAKQFNIPVRVKSTLDPAAEGTLISRIKSDTGSSIKAVAAKDGITAIKIRSSRMLMAYGFLRKIFEVFEMHKTPIDMITTSEVAVSLTVDNTENLYEIIAELEPFGEVEVDYNQSIICVVGNLIADDQGVVLCVFQSLEKIPVRMISYGGSKNNISLLISSRLKSKALKALNSGLFNL